MDLGSLEILLSRFEQSRRYEVFTSDMHKQTLEENHRIIDENEKLQRLLSEAQHEILILKQKAADRRGLSQSADAPPSKKNCPGFSTRLTSDLLGPDSKIPTECPLGGCTNYASVHQRGSDTLKNFQNHMNNTHRVFGPHKLFVSYFCADVACLF